MTLVIKNKEAASGLMGPTISISFWQAGKKYADPEGLLTYDPECRPSGKYLPRESNFHLNNETFVDTWQLPKENNYFLTRSFKLKPWQWTSSDWPQSHMPTRLHLISKNQWLWHGMMNSKFSNKCYRDCWPEHTSRSGWLSTRTKLQNVEMSPLS